MKGKLFKSKNTWKIKFKDYPTNDIGEEIPLHPDDFESLDKLVQDGGCHSVPVEFVVVSEYDELGGDFHYAKLSDAEEKIDNKNKILYGV